MIIEVCYSAAHDPEQLITRRVKSLEDLEPALDDLQAAGSRLHSVICREEMQQARPGPGLKRP